MSGSSYEGQIVLNYRLLRKLGEGGFGVVYLAEHTEIGRRAACKILFPEFVRRPELVERFFNEAKVVCSIGHRSIIDIQNFGSLPSGEPFFLMEYFPGEDLTTYIERNGPLTLPLAAKVFDSVAQGLSAAHGKNVIHRDLKPGNIMVHQSSGALDEVRLLDFGIAKLLDSADSSSSRTGVAMGTPTFMAPEQVRDAKNVDQRADIYGFAATLFTALTGHKPFRGENYPELILAVANQPPPRLSQFLPSVSSELDIIVARCMSKAPAQRPHSLDEAWAQIRAAMVPTKAQGTAIAPVTRYHPQPERPVADPWTQRGQTTLASAGSEMRSSHARRKRNWGWVSLGAVLTSLVSLIAFLASVGETPLKNSGDNQNAWQLGQDASQPEGGISPAGRDVAPADAGTTQPRRDASQPEGSNLTAGHDAAPGDAGTTQRVAQDGSPTNRASPTTMEKTTRTRRRCSESSFRKVYKARKPGEEDLHEALDRLKSCLESKSIEEDAFERIGQKIFERF